MDQLTFFAEERPASHSPLQASEAEWMTSVATSPLGIVAWLKENSPVGSFGKMCPASCHLTEDGILVPLSGRWSNSGMASAGEFLTLSTCEWTALPEQFRRDDGVSCLSDILETSDVPERYYLSVKACKGILRRVEKRGKSLPAPLAHALKAVVDSEQISKSTAA